MINKQSETPALAEGGASPQPDRIMKTTSKHLRLLAAVALAAAWGFVGNATAAFSPPDIADCSLWLDGSDVDGNGVPDTYTDGQAIGTWVDKSGLGNNFANSSASQPVFKAGLDILDQILNGWAICLFSERWKTKVKIGNKVVRRHIVYIEYAKFYLEDGSRAPANHGQQVELSHGQASSPLNPGAGAF